MSIVFGILGAVFGLAGLGCWVTIMMDAFEDEVWKGLLCLCIPLYVLYYAVVEFDHDKKWLVLLVYLLGTPLGITLFTLAFMK